MAKLILINTGGTFYADGLTAAEVTDPGALLTTYVPSLFILVNSTGTYSFPLVSASNITGEVSAVGKPASSVVIAGGLVDVDGSVSSVGDPAFVATRTITAIISTGALGTPQFYQETLTTTSRSIFPTIRAVVSPQSPYWRSGQEIEASVIEAIISLVVSSATAATPSVVTEVTVLEIIYADATLTILEVTTITESIAAVSSLSAAGSIFHAALSQFLSVRDALIVSWAVALIESTTTTDASASDLEKSVSLVERMYLSGAVSTRLDAVAAAVSAIVLTDLLSSGKGASVSEATNISDNLAHRMTALLALTESAVLDATPQYTGIITSPVLESLDVSEDSSPNQILQNLITEQVAFEITFGLAGEVYSGWVMNTDNFAVSEYQNYPFNSFAKIGTSYYGANGNGLYLLEGSDDAGTDIDATLTTGKMSFGPGLSRVANSYLALRNDGRILLKTVTDDDVEHWHEITSSDWTLNDKRVKLGRGVKSKYWQFTLANADGADFEFNELVLLPVLLKRR